MKDGMGPRRVCVGRVHRGDSFLAALKQILEKLLAGADGSLFKSDDVNIVLIVFSKFELVSFIEQVVQLSAVYFVEGESGFEVFEVGLSDCYFTLAR